jgi:hypothetical protein
MLAIAISLLIGLAAALAVQVVYSSVRQALRAHARLAGELARFDRAAQFKRRQAVPTGGAQPRHAAA